MTTKFLEEIDLICNDLKREFSEIDTENDQVLLSFFLFKIFLVIYFSFSNNWIKSIRVFFSQFLIMIN